MKFETTKPNFAQNGALAVTTSTIKASRKSYRMQVDELYTDKTSAPIRELITNGLDSHRRAMQDRPVFVHGPTPTDPSTWVRDYGIGMSDLVMRTQYIVLGASDKDEQDDEAGMWGIGAMAPFAVGIQQYSITCYDGDRKREYIFSESDAELPQLFLMAETPCDEPRGVKVSFIADEKLNADITAAIQFVIAGCAPGLVESNVKLPDDYAVVSQGDGWRVCKGFPNPKACNNHYRSTQAAVLVNQGDVLYPVGRDWLIEMVNPLLKGIPGNSLYTRMESNGLTLVLDMPIGSVRPTPSREGIQTEDAKTKEAVYRAFKNYQDELATALREKLSNIADVREFFKAVGKSFPVVLSHQIDQIKHDLTHKATGLQTPEYPIQLPEAACVKVERVTNTYLNAQAGAMPYKIEAAQIRVTDTDPIILIDKIDPFLDPSLRGDRGTETNLTRSELRRIMRYLMPRFTELFEDRALVKVRVAFNVDVADEKADALFGEGVWSRLAYDTLIEALPKRKRPEGVVRASSIPGIAIAKGDGEQRPLYSFEGIAEPVKYVQGHEWRKDGPAFYRLSRHMQIGTLLIVDSTGKETVEQRGYQHLQKYLVELSETKAPRSHYTRALEHRVGWSTATLEYRLWKLLGATVDAGLTQELDDFIAKDGYLSAFFSALRPLAETGEANTELAKLFDFRLGSKTVLDIFPEMKAPGLPQELAPVLRSIQLTNTNTYSWRTNEVPLYRALYALTEPHKYRADEIPSLLQMLAAAQDNLARPYEPKAN